MANTRMNRVIYKTGVAALIAIAVFSFLANSALACTPPPVTPWFTEGVGFVETNLPSTVTQSNDLTFTNAGNSSFYGRFNGETKDLGKQISFRLNTYEDFDTIWINNNIFSNFEHRNKIGDNRPSDVQPPNVQDVVIPIILDEKQYAIKLRINYEISNYYVPNSVETHNNSCRYYPFLPLPWFLSPAIAGGIILLVLIFVMVIRKSKLSNKPSENRK